MRGFRFPSSLYSDPRKKPLDQSAIALIAPSQSQAQFGPVFGYDGCLVPNNHLRYFESINRRYIIGWPE